MKNVWNTKKYFVAESWASGKDEVREKMGIQCKSGRNSNLLLNNLNFML